MVNKRYVSNELCVPEKLRRIRKAERITADVNAGKKIDFGKHKKHKKHKEKDHKGPDKHKDVEAGVK